LDYRRASAIATAIAARGQARHARAGCGATGVQALSGVTGGQVDGGAEGVEVIADEARGLGFGARIGGLGGEERVAVEVLARLKQAVGVEGR